MLKTSVHKHTLNFKRPSGTSRGVLTDKDSWIVEIWEKNNPSVKGIGEISIIKSLSPEWNEDYPALIEETLEQINDLDFPFLTSLAAYPSLRFGLESAYRDLMNGGKQIYYSNQFSKGEDSILINGLIWMGNKDEMMEQIEAKLKDGFHCIKMKIGAINFEEECALLEYIRSQYSPEQIELRVDANGAFNAVDAMDKLSRLSEFHLHSIEQPIKQGQWESMRRLCASTPLPIALDEELIGIESIEEKQVLLEKIQPQYIILKPSLVGGFKSCDEWISVAESLGINWWITSALESNIGLNAIAQYTYEKNNPLPQGLGTGQLYTNNIPSGLELLNDKLWLR